MRGWSLAFSASLLTLTSCRTPSFEIVDEIQYTFDGVGKDRRPRGCRVVEGDWSVRDETLVADATSGAARIDFDSVVCENVAIEADVTFLEVASPTSWAAIRFGIEGNGALQHVGTLRSGSTRSNGVEYAVWRPEGGWQVRVQAPTKTPSPVGETRRLRVLTCGGRVRVSIDGQLAVESALARDVRPGGVGLQVARGVLVRVLLHLVGRRPRDRAVVLDVQPLDVASVRLRHRLQALQVQHVGHLTRLSRQCPHRTRRSGARSRRRPKPWSRPPVHSHLGGLCAG